MLDAHRIAFYETAPSMWGISAGGIWVNEDAAIVEARRLMTEFPVRRTAMKDWFEREIAEAHGPIGSLSGA